MRGLWPAGTGNVEAFVGEFDTQFVIGIRKDITVKFLDQAVIQDNTGAIIYNLPQQDMVAMRFTMRVGWQVANQIRFGSASITAGDAGGGAASWRRRNKGRRPVVT